MEQTASAIHGLLRLKPEALPGLVQILTVFADALSTASPAPVQCTVSPIHEGEEQEGPLESTDLFLEGRGIRFLANVKAGMQFTYSLSVEGQEHRGGTVGTASPAPASPQAPASEPEMTVARMESFNRRARQEATLLSNLEGILLGSDFLFQAEKQFAAAMAGAYVAGGIDAASPPGERPDQGLIQDLRKEAHVYRSYRAGGLMGLAADALASQPTEAAPACASCAELRARLHALADGWADGTVIDGYCADELRAALKGQ